MKKRVDDKSKGWGMSPSTVVDLISAKTYWQQEKDELIVRHKLFHAYARGYSSQEN